MSAIAPTIELTNIHKRFGDLEVLKGLDLTARKGDVIAMIGASGSGKSTFLRCANLLEVPDQGSVKISGHDIAFKTGRGGQRLPADMADVNRMRSKLAMVFQQFNLWSHMSVLQNVTEAPVQVLKEDRKDAETHGMELLARVGIADKAHQYPAQLSGGQQQRAAIARALAVRPEVMLFDEPTSALDPELVGEVLDVIRALAEEGRTMILVTHEMRFARDVASEIIYLHEGRIEEQGSPEQVFTNAVSERCRRFLSRVY